MVLEDVEDPSCDGLMGFKKISTTSVLETGKISPFTVPDGGVVLSRPKPTLGCSTHDDDDDFFDYLPTLYQLRITMTDKQRGIRKKPVAAYCKGTLPAHS
jgi:hypothetical protein